MDNKIKNSLLETGTTILGIVCKDGVVMAADRQVTAGSSIIMHKDFQKVNILNDYIIISWCGGVSSAQRLSKILSAELRLKELRSKSRPTVKQVASLVSTISYSEIRQPSMIPNIVGTLIAGFNEDGSTELYSIEPSGGICKINDYDANMGSGMPYVLGFLERNYKKDIDVKQGIELALESIKSSTQRDTGSGCGIDIYAITSGEIKKAVQKEILPEYKDN